MKYLPLLCLFVLSSLSGVHAQAQKEAHPLEGMWQGVITKNGIHSQEGYKFELFLKVGEKGEITGRSFIYLSETTIVEMDVKGKLYGDRSVYIADVNYITSETVDYVPEFSRKYQFIHNRSIFDSSLEGYWQQVIKDPFHTKRERGRIKLKKIKSKV